MNVRENVGYGLSPPGPAWWRLQARASRRTARTGRHDRPRRTRPHRAIGRTATTHCPGARSRTGAGTVALDEPLSALDVRLRERLRVTLREIQQSLDITTVYVTHDQEEALAISDRVAVVADGGSNRSALPRRSIDRPRPVSSPSSSVTTTSSTALSRVRTRLTSLSTTRRSHSRQRPRSVRGPSDAVDSARGSLLPRARCLHHGHRPAGGIPR